MRFADELRTQRWFCIALISIALASVLIAGNLVPNWIRIFDEASRFSPRIGFSTDFAHGWPLPFMVRSGSTGVMSSYYGPWPFDASPLVGFDWKPLLQDVALALVCVVRLSIAASSSRKLQGFRIRFGLRTVLIAYFVCAMAFGLVGATIPFVFTGIASAAIVVCFLATLLFLFKDAASTLRQR